MFKLKGVSLYYCLLCLFACQPTPEAAPEAQEKSPVAQESSLASSDATAATNLLLGRWVSVQDSDSDFEPWAFFDPQKVYGDGSEAGIPYTLEADKIIYGLPDTQFTNRVIELTASRFVEETESGIRTVWTKADL